MLMKVNICTFSNQHLFPRADPASAEPLKPGDRPPEAWLRLSFLPLKRKMLAHYHINQEEQFGL